MSFGFVRRESSARKNLIRKARSDINTLQRFTKILSNAAVLLYVAVSLFTLSNCTRTDDAATIDQLNSAKQKTASLMLREFDAEIFNANSKQILNRPVVLDSTLIGITEKAGQYFLRAEVKLKGRQKYFAELKCTPEIADTFYRTKSNSALIAAKISRIDDCAMLAEADSLDGNRSQFNLGKSILLSGECLALVEIPASINAD